MNIFLTLIVTKQYTCKSQHQTYIMFLYDKKLCLVLVLIYLFCKAFLLTYKYFITTFSIYAENQSLRVQGTLSLLNTFGQRSHSVLPRHQHAGISILTLRIAILVNTSVSIIDQISHCHLLNIKAKNGQRKHCHNKASM